MKKKLTLTLLLVVMQLISLYAQESIEASPSNVNLGIGIGMDYGGFGGKFSFLPSQKFALFAGVGYNLLEIGFNGGVQYRFSPDKKICPTLGAMYGYNSVIVIKGAEQYSKTYYGPSVFFSLEFKSGKNPKNYFSTGLVIPFRSQEYKDDLNDLDNNPNIKLETKPLPFGISAGFHFGL